MGSGNILFTCPTVQMIYISTHFTKMQAVLHVMLSLQYKYRLHTEGKVAQ